jgi:hypothetical protein
MHEYWNEFDSGSTIAPGDVFCNMPWLVRRIDSRLNAINITHILVMEMMVIV